MTKHIGILTAGGDSPGLNAAIRAVGKTANFCYDMKVIGFKDGFKGLVDNRTQRLDEDHLSGILTIGGTILGTSRYKPHRMPVGGKIMDMTDAIIENYQLNHLDALVCLGGGGTQKNALRLMNKGLNIITLPKTIDNDVVETDMSFGFYTALGIATEALDRLHSTAHSHHRIIVVEIMGHKAGWLALGAGIAGGADVILIPEIPYAVDNIAEDILHRVRQGKQFSIVAVAEGAMSQQQFDEMAPFVVLKQQASNKEEKKKAKEALAKIRQAYVDTTLHLARELEVLTGLESRVTILGYLQRGGTPSAADRLLATRLGASCVDYVNQGLFGVMVASNGQETHPVSLDKVAGFRKTVPLDHDWIKTARHVGTCLGD